MKKIFLLFISAICAANITPAQNVGIGTTSPDPSAQLEVQSTKAGILIPRMSSAERTGIASPAVGLLVYDNVTNSFWYYKTTGWTELVTGGGVGYWSANGGYIYNNNTGNVGIGTSNPLAKLHVAGNVKVDGANTIEFGAGVAGKEGNAGKIGYQTFGAFDALDIVGAGTSGSNRKIRFWNEGGAEFRSNVGIGSVPSDFMLNVSSNVVQSNTNTNLLKLVGQNPVMVFSNGVTDFGYLKAWSYLPYAPFTNGLVIGSSPGYPIFFSTNNYSLSMIVADNGNVGIGTSNPTYKLSVNGNIHTKEVVVETGWADYVFDKNYKLPLLSDVEKFIQQNNHLPEIPSAAEIDKKGLHLGDTQKKMMEKIEELTLYMIEANKKIERLEQLIQEKK